MVAPRFTEDTFQEVDEMMVTLEQDGRIDINQYWAAQSYYAILAGRRGHLKMMPYEYNTHKGRTRRNAVIRHYVGSPQIRYRYFTQGIPRLLKQIS